MEEVRGGEEGKKGRGKEGRRKEEEEQQEEILRRGTWAFEALGPWAFRPVGI